MNILIAFCFLSGSLVMLLAALGVVKFQDTLLRLHAASKSASFGVMLLLAGTILYFRDWSVTLMLLAVVVLLVIKTPVASQAIARAAYFLDDPSLWESLVLDEWHGKTGPPRKKRRARQ